MTRASPSRPRRQAGDGGADVDTQTIVQGPMASQVAIKMLGTNGGGYVNANAAHPFENPTPLSNFLQMLSIFAIPSGLTYYLGRMVEEPGPRLGGVGGDVRRRFCWRARLLAVRGGGQSRIIAALASIAADGNMEGKEVRFGIFNSALFATITTDASCGAVNSMHDSFHAAGRTGSVAQHPARRDHLWRRRRRPLRHARLRRARGLHRRPDGRTHAGVSRQEDRALRREDGVVRDSGPDLLHPWLHRLGLRQQMGTCAGLATTAARMASAKSSTPTALPPATTAAPLPA